MKPSARFIQEEAGSAMIEMTLVVSLLFILTMGFVDFGYALYQWNSASKAVDVGARMASISAPIAPEIRNSGPSTVVAGDPIPAGNYDYVCTSTACTCTGAGCVAVTFTAANFNRIFYGDDASCVGVANVRPGMCDFFPKLQPSNVRVRYTATGLGYQGRPGGAVPTITVSLQGLTYQFFFVGGLLGLNSMTMPSMLSTATGEDMKSTYP